MLARSHLAAPPAPEAPQPDRPLAGKEPASPGRTPRPANGVQAWEPIRGRLPGEPHTVGSRVHQLRALHAKGQHPAPLLATAPTVPVEVARVPAKVSPKEVVPDVIEAARQKLASDLAQSLHSGELRAASKEARAPKEPSRSLVPRKPRAPRPAHGLRPWAPVGEQLRSEANTVSSCIEKLMAIRRRGEQNPARLLALRSIHEEVTQKRRDVREPTPTTREPTPVWDREPTPVSAVPEFLESTEVLAPHLTPHRSASKEFLRGRVARAPRPVDGMQAWAPISSRAVHEVNTVSTRVHQIRALRAAGRNKSVLYGNLKEEPELPQENASKLDTAVEAEETADGLTEALAEALAEADADIEEP